MLTMTKEGCKSMKYAEAHRGRTFVLRLEEGEVMHEVIEAFAKKERVRRAVVISLGGAESGRELITGPEEGKGFQKGEAINTHFLGGVHESSGVGTLFPNEDGTPVLHLHLSCGRKDQGVTGCARNGVVVWLYMEVVILEIIGECGKRVVDPLSGFALLDPKA